MSDGVKQVAVLAGGRSSRMGVDKAAVRVGGMMMLERAVRTAMEVCQSVMVVGRAEGPAGWAEDLGGVRFLVDRGEEFGGPLSGLITAVEDAGEEVLLFGCDMPLVREGTLRGLMTAHAAAPAGMLATMAVSRDEAGKEYAEPTLSVYSPGLLPMLKEMMRSGRRSFQPLLRERFVWKWEVPTEAVRELLNVNDAETLAEAERVLRGAGWKVG
jgi:molybdenum cofactor guanylyltransferase